MALHWDLKAAEENEANKSEANLYAVCVMAVHTGMPEITEENAAEFYLRASVIEALIGAFRSSDSGDVRFTLEEVRAFAGLKTNVSPYTRRQFLANVNRIMNETAKDLDRKQA